MTIREELEALTNGNDVLHAADVVQWAKAHKTSELYTQFEWDDSKAGHEYRLHQARYLIRLHIVNDEGFPEFVSLTLDRGQPRGGYRRLQDVLSTPNLRDILLRDAFNDLERLRKKYERLQELAGVWREVARAKRGRKPVKQAKRSTAPRSVSLPSRA